MCHTLCISLLISAYRQLAIHGVSSEENFYKCLELCENFFILVKGLFKMREDKLKKDITPQPLVCENTQTLTGAVISKTSLFKLNPSRINS